MSIERAHQVDLSPSPLPSRPLLLMDGTSLELTWSPAEIFPEANTNNAPFNLDILLFTLTLDRGSTRWVKHSTLVENTDNDGSEVVALPTGISSDDIVPVVIQIATSLHPSTRFDTDEMLYMKLFRSQQRVGVWTSEYYYVSPVAAGRGGRQMCQDWYDQEPDNLPVALTTGSTPCSPTLAQAQLPTSGLMEVSLTSALGGNSLYRGQWFDTFHKEAVQCFREAAAATSDLPTEQECCYDDRGFLITGSHNGGAVKKVSKDVSRARHFDEDTRPYLLCCTGLTPNCGLYYTKRPSDDGSRFSPPPPGGCGCLSDNPLAFAV